MNIATIYKIHKLQIIYKSFLIYEHCLAWLESVKGRFKLLKLSNAKHIVSKCDTKYNFRMIHRLQLLP